MEKRVSESRTEQVQILTQAELNGYGRLFGGKLMEWIDIVAAVTARRHCGKKQGGQGTDGKDRIRLLEGGVTDHSAVNVSACAVCPSHSDPFV